LFPFAMVKTLRQRRVVNMSEQALLARAGGLEVRLAASAVEIRAAQALRYRVFFEEGGAASDPVSRASRLDVCRFDEVCDHVLAIDVAAPRGADGAPPVVGAYRLLRQDVAGRAFGFYSAGEFDVGALVARHPHLSFLELGRSCVAQGYRSKRVIETLWRGVWAYALRHGVDVMFGCASLPGAEASAHAAALAALCARCGAEPEWSAPPVASARRAEIAGVPAGDPRAALRALPPLVKGYLRLGAKVGRQAVIDESFGTTDIFIVLRVADIRARYLEYFAPDELIAA
jgi:putative hemolysin